MCGKGGQLFDAEIEGGTLVVCASCAKFGKVIRKHSEEKFVPKYVESKKQQVVSGPTKMIVNNYSSLIKKARERRGMKQDEFAKLLQERESTVQHWESGKLEPSIAVAERIEKQLKINLVETYKEQVLVDASSDEDKSRSMTIGDLIKFRKK